MSSGQGRGGTADERLSAERAPAERAPVDRAGGERAARRSRARWRELSGPALRAEPAPPAGDLGDDDFWSYLRGNKAGVEPANQDRDLAEADSDPAGPDRDVAEAEREPAGPERDLAEPDGDAGAGAQTREPEPAESREPVSTPPPGPFWATAATTHLSTETFWPEPTTAAPDPAPYQASDQPTTAEPVAEHQPVGDAATPAEHQPVGDAATPAEHQPVGDAATPAEPDAATPPAWRSLVRPDRRMREPRGILRRSAPTVVAALGWLAVVAYGALRFDLPWSLGALAAGVVAFALGLRGRSAMGLAPVLLGAVAWGMATGGQAPTSLADLPGDALLIGWNALYAVPLLVTYALATRAVAPERDA